MKKSRSYLVFVGLVFCAFAVKWIISVRRPDPVPKSRELPDYSGITIDHVVKERIKKGAGDKIEIGDKVKVHYQMWIYDPGAPGNHGRKLSADSFQAMDITIGDHDVIDGWEQSLIGMQAGEETIFVIPPVRAYGTAGSPGKVPGRAIIQVAMMLIAIENRYSVQPRSPSFRKDAA